MNNIQYKAVAAPYTDRQLFNAKFSRDGKLLIAGSYQGDLRRFDLTEDEPTELTPFETIMAGYRRLLCILLKPNYFRRFMG